MKQPPQREPPEPLRATQFLDEQPFNTKTSNQDEQHGIQDKYGSSLVSVGQPKPPLENELSRAPPGPCLGLLFEGPPGPLGGTLKKSIIPRQDDHLCKNLALYTRGCTKSACCFPARVHFQKCGNRRGETRFFKGQAVGVRVEAKRTGALL